MSETKTDEPIYSVCQRCLNKIRFEPVINQDKKDLRNGISYDVHAPYVNVFITEQEELRKLDHSAFAIGRRGDKNYIICDECTKELYQFLSKKGG